MRHIVLNILILIASILALVKGSDIFINQSSAIARKYRIPEFLIGITIVAFGTSLPELIISVVAAIQGSTEITVSNVVGSSIANVGFILAIAAMFGAIKIHKNNLKFDIPLSVISVLIFLGILFFSHGSVNWVVGLLFLLIFTIYFVIVYLREKKKDTGQSVGLRIKVHPLLFV